MIEIDPRFVLDSRKDPGLSESGSANPYDPVRAFLDYHGVPKSAYCIGIPDCDQKNCLHFENDFWVIYFSERGARTNPSFHTNWSDAVKVFGYLLASIYARENFPRIGQI